MACGTCVLLFSLAFPCLLKAVYACCASGTAYLDLQQGTSSIDPESGINLVGSITSQSSGGPCNKQALLKVNFEKLGNSSACVLTEGCLQQPYCGRRMLRIDLSLSSTNRSGRLFHVGDSVSNNGLRGDGNHQENDAEMESIYPHVYVWSSDKCNTNSSLSRLATYSNTLDLTSVTKVSLYIGNNFIRITNHVGLDETLCHECLYALNGQSDSSSGGINEDIYVSLNRIISSTTFRNGYGTCYAYLSWTCPW